MHANSRQGASSGDGREARGSIGKCVDALVRLEERLKEASFPEQAAECERLKDALLRQLVKEDDADAPVAVGVIGEFSAGKSSFINSLLGEELCPTSDEATTSAITVFRHQRRADVEFFQTDAERKTETPISREEYGRLARHGSGREDAFYFACTLDAPELDGIALYDTPGFNNANSEKGRRDTELTEEILENMDAIFYVADIETGSLGNYGLERLRPFREKGTPVYLILNKEDRKSPSARERILAQCQEEFDGFAGAMRYSSTEEMHVRRSSKRNTLYDWLEVTRKELVGERISRKHERLCALKNEIIKFLDSCVSESPGGTVDGEIGEIIAAISAWDDWDKEYLLGDFFENPIIAILEENIVQYPDPDEGIMDILFGSQPYKMTFDNFRLELNSEIDESIDTIWTLITSKFILDFKKYDNESIFMNSLYFKEYYEDKYFDEKFDLCDVLSDMYYEACCQIDVVQADLSYKDEDKKDREIWKIMESKRSSSQTLIRSFINSTLNSFKSYLIEDLNRKRAESEQGTALNQRIQEQIAAVRESLAAI